MRIDRKEGEWFPVKVGLREREKENKSDTDGYY